MTSWLRAATIGVAPPANEQSKFRNDIQLLRAAAVVSVIAYHLRLPGFGNGFLGVDVFFVISGFLMEKLYRPSSGAVAFYHRRAKRLLPPYFVTVWLTAVAAILLLLPEAVSRMAGQVQAAGLLSSNFLHWSEESYFTNTYFSPLLHLWSLALELQFYLLFPVLSDWTRKAKWRLPAIAIVSVALCLAAVLVSPKTAFFMMPLRVWQFAVGMIVARLIIRPSSGWIAAAAVAGLAALMFFPIDGPAQSVVHGHPAMAAVICSLLVGLLIATGIPNRLVPTIAIKIGDVSYSLYLVHFPVIVLFFYRPFEGTNLGDGDLSAALIPIAIMVAACAALYFTVERKAADLFRWKYLALAIVATLGLAWVMVPAAQLRADPFIDRLSQSLTDREPPRCGKFYRITNWRETMCVYGSRSAPKLYLLGDSHTEVIAKEVRELAAKKGLSVMMPAKREDFQKPLAWQLAQMRRYGATEVLMTWRDHETDIERISALAEGLSATMPVAVLLPQPELGKPAPQLALEAYRRGKAQAVIDAAPYRTRIRTLASSFKDMPNVRVYDPSSLCTSTCPLNAENGASYFFDGNHLTLTGAARLRPVLKRAVDESRNLRGGLGR